MRSKPIRQNRLGSQFSEPLESRCVFAGQGLADDPTGQSALATEVSSLTAAAPVAPAPAPDLMTNSGFETGTTGWQRQGNVTLTSVGASNAHSGERGVLVSNRTAFWNGLGQSLLGKLPANTPYRFSAWVKLATPGTQRATITISQLDGQGQQYFGVAQAQVTDREWTKLDGGFTLQTQGSLSTLFCYLEGPDPGVNMYVDDFSVTPFEDDGAWRPAADARIEQIRKREVEVQVVDQNGNPLSGVEVHVDQQRNLFGFGTAISADAMKEPRYREFLREHFQWGVVENALKWPSYEPRQGDFNTGPADNIINFAKNIGMPLRGHNIFWEVEEFVPDWVKALNNEQLRAAVTKRIQDVVGRYKEDLIHWDVNNEMLHGDFFQRRLGPEIRAQMFKESEALAPRIVQFVNDYNVVAGGETEAYVQQIQGLLDQGAPIEGIGVQGHFSYVVPELVLQRLDRLATFSIPIWVTEFDVQFADENLRAQQLETFYRLAFSHPGVEGIMMWGFWEGAHWRGSTASLVNRDWTVNAAGRAFLNLMEEWRTELTEDTSTEGKVDFRGFHGTYQVQVKLPNGKVNVYDAAVEPGTGVQTVRLVVDSTNAAPSIAMPSSFQVTRSGQQTFAITLGDDQTAAEDLKLAVTSRNHAILGPEGISITGTGAQRTLTLTPELLAQGTVTLDFEARDAQGAVTKQSAVLYVVAPKRDENLTPNGGFEDGDLDSFGKNTGQVNVTITQALARSGDSSLLVSNRQQFWNGPTIDLMGRLLPREGAQITAYVRLKTPGTATADLLVRKVDGSGVSFPGLASATVTNTAWTRLQGVFRYNPSGVTTELTAYIQVSNSTAEFYVDDISVLIVNAVRDGDVNGDGKIDINDFILIRNNFGKPATSRSQGDLNQDLQVDLQDFVILRNYFGR